MNKSLRRVRNAAITVNLRANQADEFPRTTNDLADVGQVIVLEEYAHFNLTSEA